MYADAWRKKQAAETLTALEAQIAQVLDDHPEYHDALGEDGIGESFEPDHGRTNPFLHMGLHLAIRDQLSTNRPEGIIDTYQ